MFFSEPDNFFYHMKQQIISFLDTKNLYIFQILAKFLMNNCRVRLLFFLYIYYNLLGQVIYKKKKKIVNKMFFRKNIPSPHPSLRKGCCPIVLSVAQFLYCMVSCGLKYSSEQNKSIFGEK